MKTLLRFSLKASLICVALGLLLLTGCQSSLIYFPRPYEVNRVTTWSKEPATTVLDYQTDDGTQQAYLLSLSKKPRHLWIVCGGNGTLALDWSDWVREHGSPEDAWLFVDIPGYGVCEGSPSPRSIRRTLKNVVPAAAQTLQWSLPQDQGRLRFFGHSLGCAVSLMAAKEYDIRQGVLLSPFTSTMDMTKVVTGVPLGFLVWHRFDNLARLKEIEKAGNGRVFILHGVNDEVIPVAMSRTLAAAAPNTVRLTEIPGGRHNTLQDMAAAEIEKALKAAREDHTNNPEDRPKSPVNR